MKRKQAQSSVPLGSGEIKEVATQGCLPFVALPVLAGSVNVAVEVLESSRKIADCRRVGLALAFELSRVRRLVRDIYNAACPLGYDAGHTGIADLAMAAGEPSVDWCKSRHAELVETQAKRPLTRFELTELTACADCVQRATPTVTRDKRHTSKRKAKS